MDLVFSISKNEKIYIQIYNKIKNDIIKKNITPNEKLPSKRIFAKALGVSINSITYAYNILIEEGYIYSIEKKGYYVNKIDFIFKKENKTADTLKVETIYSYDLTTSYIDESDLYKKTINKIIRETITKENYFKRQFFSGNYNLKSTIAKMLYTEKNINVNPNQIVLSNGSNNLIKKIMYLLSEKTIAVEYPGYYNEKMLGINCEYINVDSKGFSALSFKESSSKIGIVTSFSEFPLGIKMPIDRKLELTKILNDQNKIIIEDSFDSDFRNNGYYTNPLFNFSNRVIYMESFSKTIYPGLCISFMALPLWLVDKYNDTYKTDSCVSSLDQLLLNEYIKNDYYTRHINRLKTLFLKKKQVILDNIDKNLFEVYSNLNYSSILVKIKKNININKIKKEINSKKIKINFLNDFYFKNEVDPILIIGFSNINLDNLSIALNMLTKIISS